ncbi:phage tail family protein [Arthrobacter alpinus]|uniref:phage tail family protein n=1 Tax=Arthrobacter alpinus TaxID=656366 RepID=UPI001FCD6043|nr:phage tail family protein [Arthrobacter alpinus]
MGTWTIHLPGGARRTLDLRLVSSEDNLLFDSIKRGWAKYGITLLADRPYWLGETVKKSWGQEDLRNYDVSLQDRIDYGYASNVINYLSAGSTLGSAAVSNDGDIPTFPAWTAVGPTTSVSFGVDGSRIKVPFGIPEGYAVQIDTDPVNGQVLWYGPWDGSKIADPVDRTSELDPTSKFVAIPRGQDRKLSIVMTGTGTVLAEVQNKYRRAW